VVPGTALVARDHPSLHPSAVRSTMIISVTNKKVRQLSVVMKVRQLSDVMKVRQLSDVMKERQLSDVISLLFTVKACIPA
jgi:uncharacterized membrane protein